MALTNAERQRACRERHRGEPRGNAAMMAQLAALQGRVAQFDLRPNGRPDAARPATAIGKPIVNVYLTNAIAK